MDYRDFILTSDTPPDYVIYKITTDYTVPDFITNVATIPHELPYAPLINGVWGLSSSLDDARSISEDHGPDLFGFAPYSIGVYSDETNIYIVTSNFSGSTMSFYFNLYGLPNPSYTGSLAGLSDYTDYTLSTDFNYLKLFSSNNTSFTTSGDKFIDHNIGFTPRILAWQRTDATIGASVPNNVYTLERIYNINENSFTINSIANKTISYRIYANG